MQNIINTKSKIGKAQIIIDEDKKTVDETYPLASDLLRHLETIAQRTLYPWLERHPNVACLIYVIWIFFSFTHNCSISRNRGARKKDEENVIGLVESSAFSGNALNAQKKYKGPLAESSSSFHKD